MQKSRYSHKCVSGGFVFPLSILWEGFLYEKKGFSPARGGDACHADRSCRRARPVCARAFYRHLYGPAGGAAVWGAADLIGALLFPRGVYFPGFTVTSALKGALFGWFLSKKNAKFFPHVVIPTAVNNIVIGLTIDTLWIAILYSSKTYWGYFVSRIPQFAALIVMNLVLIPALMKLCGTLKKHVRL